MPGSPSLDHVRERGVLVAAERGFAFVVEDIRNGAMLRDDQIVGIEEGALEFARKAFADRRLTRRP